MYGLKKHTKQDKGGMIRGAGTGTSDDIKKNVPAGSYIMPADSTQQIGGDNLKDMGNPTPVNLSNGEFELSPEQVHSVGVQTLDAMKDQTHTPVNQPQLGFKPGQNKPELFFANGGDVPEWDVDDTVKTAVIGGVGGAYGAAKAINSVPSVIGSAPNAPVTAGQVAKKVGGFAKSALGEMPKSAGTKLGAVGVLGSTAFTTATTPTEKYRERFGFQTDNPSFAGDLAMRALGAASDLPSNFTGGVLGKHLYRDNTNAMTANTAPQTVANTQKKAVADKPAVTTLPSTDTTAKANTPSTTFPSMFADTPTQNSNKPAGNPYAIQQKGNSFSYADAGAAAQARANGVPELQSSGVQAGRGVTGIKNFMANTREIGPTEQQIQNAIAQREMNIGMQGYSDNPVQAPQRNYLQEAERQAVIRAANTPIAGARGLTANQVRTLSDLQQGEDNRANQRYTTDANNVAALQREAMGQAGQNLRTTMGEQGANYRTELGERGTNNRFAATNDLANRQYTQDQVDKMPARMKEQAELNLLKQYDAATTDEQRKAIAAKRDFLMGRTQEQQAGKLTPFKQYEVTDDKGNVTQPAKDYFIDERGRTIDPLAGQLPPIGENPAVKAIMDNNSLSKDEKMAQIVGLGYTNT